MVAAVAGPETCPRCGRELVVNHDETLCLVHGLVYTPKRAYDASQDQREDFEAPLKQPRLYRRRDEHRGSRTPSPEWAYLEAVERGEVDALDADEWDAAMSGKGSAEKFEVKPRCLGCGKRTLVASRCLVCDRERLLWAK